jgi:hypothetical protein
MVKLKKTVFSAMLAKKNQKSATIFPFLHQHHESYEQFHPIMKKKKTHSLY